METFKHSYRSLLQRKGHKKIRGNRRKKKKKNKREKKRVGGGWDQKKKGIPNLTQGLVRVIENELGIPEPSAILNFPITLGLLAYALRPRVGPTVGELIDGLLNPLPICQGEMIPYPASTTWPCTTCITAARS